MVPEISDRIVEIDRAMRWGYANKLGPFELWDALGVPETVARMRQENRAIPANVEKMLATGAKSFYEAPDHDRRPHHEYFDLQAGSYQWLEDRPGITVLKDVKRAHGVVKKNAGASLIDLGDGVLCLEFHSKMNSLGDDQISMHPRRHRRNQQELRRHGHRQPGRKLQRRRQPHAGASGRTGRRVGRTESAINRFQQATMADQVCAQAGSRGPVRHDPRRRLRNRYPFRARTSLRRDLYGIWWKSASA